MGKEYTLRYSDVGFAIKFEKDWPKDDFDIWLTPEFDETPNIKDFPDDLIRKLLLENSSEHLFVVIDFSNIYLADGVYESSSEDTTIRLDITNMVKLVKKMAKQFPDNLVCLEVKGIDSNNETLLFSILDNLSTKEPITHLSLESIDLSKLNQDDLRTKLSQCTALRQLTLTNALGCYRNDPLNELTQQLPPNLETVLFPENHKFLENVYWFIQYLQVSQPNIEISWIKEKQSSTTPDYHVKDFVSDAGWLASWTTNRIWNWVAPGSQTKALSVDDFEQGDDDSPTFESDSDSDTSEINKGEGKERKLPGNKADDSTQPESNSGNDTGKINKEKEEERKLPGNKANYQSEFGLEQKQRPILNWPSKQPVNQQKPASEADTDSDESREYDFLPEERRWQPELVKEKPHEVPPAPPSFSLLNLFVGALKGASLLVAAVAIGSLVAVAVTLTVAATGAALPAAAVGIGIGTGVITTALCTALLESTLFSSKSPSNNRSTETEDSSMPAIIG